VIGKTDPKRVGLIGTSAGGALVLEMGLRAKQLGLPMPGAIASGTPMSDSTKTGDSFYTNAMLDNVLVSTEGFCDAAAAFYAKGHDLKDPLISPIYGDMSGFPPTILTSETRDLLLSNTVRVHRKLRNLGIDSFLQVYEGQSHAQYGRDDRIPEVREAFTEIGTFLNSHLKRWRSRPGRTSLRHDGSLDERRQPPDRQYAICPLLVKKPRFVTMDAVPSSCALPVALAKRPLPPWKDSMPTKVTSPDCVSSIALPWKVASSWSPLAAVYVVMLARESITPDGPASANDTICWTTAVVRPRCASVQS